MDELKIRLEPILNNKLASLGVAFLALVVIFFVLIVSGRQNCSLISLSDGVVKSCDCRGFEITVKSTTNSREQKTICVGTISNRQSY